MLDLGIEKQYRNLYLILQEQIGKFVKSLVPEEVAQVCEKIISKIVSIFFVDKIEQDTIVRLYLHLACMCDRVHLNEALVEPDWAENIKEARVKEYDLLDNIINSCVNRLDLTIPSGELCYLLNSLPKINDKAK